MNLCIRRERMSGKGRENQIHLAGFVPFWGLHSVQTEKTSDFLLCPPTLSHSNLLSLICNQFLA